MARRSFVWWNLVGYQTETEQELYKMIARLVAWSARCHWVVIVSTLVLAVAGNFARRALAGDVMPDL